jgi:orsellinic acid C2-O-methyltransferase
VFDLTRENPVLTLTQLSATIALPRILREVAQLQLGHLVAERPRSLADIASHYGFDERVLALVLDILVGNDILVEEDGLYHPTCLSDELDLIDQLFVGMEGWHCWSQLDHSLRTGEPAFKHVYGMDFFSYLASHPQKNANWKRWNSVTAQEWFQEVAQILPLDGSESICDVGGGEGELLCRLLEYYPDCRGTLLERPEVAPFQDAPFAWVAGDMFKAVPAGHDLYILSRVFCNWNDEHMLTVLRNIAAAMQPSSRLVIIDGVLPEKDDPERAIYVANSLNLFLMFGSRLRELTEFEALLARADFELTQVKQLDTELGIIWHIIIASKL